MDKETKKQTKNNTKSQTKQTRKKQPNTLAKSQTKKPIKNPPKKEKTWKDYCTSMPVLWTVFILLLIVVIVLSVLVYQKNEENKKNIKANIVIPVVEKESSFHFNVNALALSQSREYIFKITNYKKEKINEEELDYSITITNPTTAVLELTKNESKKNLMLDQKSTVINGEHLAKEEQEDIIYHLKILSAEKLDNNELIQVEIFNKN